MANSVETRVRFAVWDALKLAARAVKDPDSKRVLRSLLREDRRLFDRHGLGERPMPKRLQELLKRKEKRLSKGFRRSKRNS